MTTVLAVDPGPSKSGAAVVELVGGWPTVLRAGHLERWELEVWLVQAVADHTFLAIEEIQGYAYEAKRVAQLVETARVEGWIAGRWFIGSQRPPLCTAAADWRQRLCGSRTASDEQVRIVVEACARGIPRVGCRARSHVLDAVGLAIDAIARLSGRALDLPPAAARALLLQQQTEKLGRGLRAVTKRAPTRAQSARRSAAAKRGWAGRT